MDKVIGIIWPDNTNVRRLTAIPRKEYQISGQSIWLVHGYAIAIKEFIRMSNSTSFTTRSNIVRYTKACLC